MLFVKRERERGERERAFFLSETVEREGENAFGLSAAKREREREREHLA